MLNNATSVGTAHNSSGTDTASVDNVTDFRGEHKNCPALAAVVAASILVRCADCRRNLERDAFAQSHNTRRIYPIAVVECIETKMLMILSRFKSR